MTPRLSPAYRGHRRHLSMIHEREGRGARVLRSIRAWLPWRRRGTVDLEVVDEQPQ